MEYINIPLSKDDADLILRCVKIAKYRKEIECRNHLKKNELENYGNKFSLIKKFSELSDHLQYLIKKN